MGWRYVVAGASLLMVVLVAANLTDEAEILRTPLIIGCVSGLVLVLSVPTQMPKSESEWFKTLGSLATSGTFLYVAWLSVDDDVRSWANGQSTQAETVWWIIAAFVVFAVIAATGLAAVGWLVRSTVQELRHRKKSVS
jgi:hypothetical protein